MRPKRVNGKGKDERFSGRTKFLLSLLKNDPTTEREAEGKKKHFLLVFCHRMHREHFVDNYMNPALENGLIEMKYPDSPNHPKQRYTLTEKGKTLSINLNNASA